MVCARCSEIVREDEEEDAATAAGGGELSASMVFVVYHLSS